MRKKLIFSLLAGFITISSYGQMTRYYSNDNALFYQGRELFQQRKYAASYRNLEKFMQTDELNHSGLAQEAAFLMGANAFELRHENASDVLTNYLITYPYSNYTDRVNNMLGQLAFEKKKYDKAIGYFKKTDETRLGDNEQTAFLFGKGYSLLETKKYEEALQPFGKLSRMNTRYNLSAGYYYSYTLYCMGNYDAALPGFLKIENHPSYKSIVPYYIVQIYYSKKDYDQLNTRTEEILKNNPNNPNNAEIYRIAGEIAYRKKDYKKAIEHLSNYEKLFPQVLRNDMYLLGLSYYETGSYSNAIKYLTKVTTDKDEISENAYMHLGNAYVKVKDMTNARLAYEAALRTNFNKTVREEALYNYALTTLETTSAFGESIKAFEQLLKEFPDTKYTDNAYDYLTSVYLTTKNYEAAYQSILKIKKPNSKLLETKQYLLYQIGTDAFMQNDYTKAIDYFTMSLLASKTGKYSAECLYWRSECYYRTGQTEKSIYDLMAFMNNANARQSENYAAAHYTLAYGYFSKKDYNESMKWFLKYADAEQKQTNASYPDALNRIGDCYFYNRNLGQATAYYQKAAALSPSTADYALYQSAFVSGLQKDYNTKISKLDNLLTKYPASEYCDDAMYETGRAYIMLNNDGKAISSYHRLLKSKPNSPLARKAAYEIGMIHYNAREYPQAADAFKNVIASYPGSDEANTALESLENVYVDMNDVPAYLAYTRTLGKGYSNKTVGREDSISYAAAERQYINANYGAAITGLKSYLEKFCPGGRYCTIAQFYMADSYYRTNDKVNALNAYMALLKISGNPYMEEAALRCSEIAYDQKDYNNALQYFKQLQSVAQNKSNKEAARLGILRCSYFLNDNQTTITIVNEIMSDPRASDDLKAEARYNRAKAYLATRQFGPAVSDLKLLAAETRTANGAESKYLLANTYFEQGKLAETENEVMDFAKKNTPYQFWLARSFVLLADVYIKQKNDFQAKQYLLSLQKNYTTADEIQTMITERLTAIQEREKQNVIN